MDDGKLLEMLLTRYAALGEEAVDLAATSLPRSRAERRRVMAALRRSASDMLKLAEAAAVVLGG